MPNSLANTCVWRKLLDVQFAGVQSRHGFPMASCLRAASLTLLLLVLSGCAQSRWSRQARLIGCLWYVTAAGPSAELNLNPGELDAIQGLGLRLVVLNGPWLGADPHSGSVDPAEQLFLEGDRRQLEFFVDTGMAAGWWNLAETTQELARARSRIESLHRRYGHHPSFKGFYVPYETYVMWGEQGDLARSLFRDVAAICKSVAPARPVMISPFFILDEQHVLGDFRWATPAEYAEFWTGVLQGSAIDIVALQDRGEHLAYYTDEQCAPFFAAMRLACDAAGKQLWANVETGELAVGSPEEYIARFGHKTHVNDPLTQPFWRGVPAEKLAEKLRFVRGYTPTAITWGYREFVRPGSDASTNLYRAYRAVLSP